MRASCENGHNRVSMHYNNACVTWICPLCHEMLTPARIERVTHPSYRRQTNTFAHTLQTMADFEVEGILKSNGRIAIEYPRPSVE